MAKFEITWWLATQYGVVVEADSQEEAYETYNDMLAGIDGAGRVVYVSDEPYDEEIEEVA